MTYEREDAQRLAYNVYRKRFYDEQAAKQEPEMEQVPTLDGLLSLQPAMPFEKVRFTNPDLTYLWRKSGFSHRFIGKMLGWFGEVVVIEALRSSIEQNVQSEPLFVTICRRLETA